MAGSAALLALWALACAEDSGSEVTIAIDPKTAEFASGDTLRFHAIVRDRGGAEVSGVEVHWATSDTAVAIDATGLATGGFTDAAKTVGVIATTGTVSASTSVVLKGCILNCGSWTVLPGISPWRERSVVVPLNGFVYVAGGGKRGGVGGTSSSKVEAFDLVAGQWSTRAAMPDSAGMGRQLAQGVALGGRLYQFGGVILNPSPPTADAWSYDPSSNGWTVLPAMPRVRIAASGLQPVTVGGRIYVVGLTPFNQFNPPVVDIYDPATNSWTFGATTSPVPSAAVGPVVIGGKIFLFGGTVGVMYDPATDTWTSRAPIPGASSTPFRAVALKGKVYAFGNCATCNLVHIYDPATNAWTSGRRAPFSSTSQGIVFADTLRGKVLVGRVGESAVYVYDPERNAWAMRTSMPSVDGNFLLGNATAVSVDSSLVVIALYTTVVQLTPKDTTAVLRFTP
jgi:N-acetylneuraminic acid mutarotase